MQRTTYPLTTVDQINALTQDSAYNIRWRIPLWADLPQDVRMRQEENDTVLLDFLAHLPTEKKEMDQPVIQWTMDERLEGWTKITAASDLTSVATITVADAKVARAGCGVFLPETNQVHLIASINDATNVITLNKTAMGGIPAAVSIGESVFILPPYMGELSEPRDVTTVLPGEPQFNYITVAAHKFTISKMQEFSNMYTGAGASFLTMPRSLQELVFKMRQQVQYGMMFQNRTTWNDATEGQFYIGGSLLSQLTSHQLDLGAVGNTFSWPNLNDFLEALFDSRQSSSHKDTVCGPAIFADALKVARDVGRIVTSVEGDTYLHPKYGGRAFDMQTDSGNSVTFIRDKGTLVGPLSYYAFVLDAKNMGGGMYKGLGPQFFMDIQSPGAVMISTAAYLDSFALNIFDETTMGLIKGGTLPLI